MPAKKHAATVTSTPTGTIPIGVAPTRLAAPLALDDALDPDPEPDPDPEDPIPV
jgi:hypothetical protein